MRQWQWRLPVVIAVFGTLGLVDLAFLSSNTLKVVQGGWLPLAMAGMVFVMIDTWRLGRRVHLEQHARRHAADRPVPGARHRRSASPARRSSSRARTDVTPGSMLHSLKHYQVLHERVVLASITVEDIPFVPVAAPGRGRTSSARASTK